MQANSVKVPKTSYPENTFIVLSAITSDNTKPSMLPTPQTKTLHVSNQSRENMPFKFIPSEIRAKKITKGL